MKISINKKPWTPIIGYTFRQDTEPVQVDYFNMVYLALAPVLVVKSYGDPPKWITDIDKNRRFGYRIKDGNMTVNGNVVEYTATGLAMLGESSVVYGYDKVPLYTTEIHALRDRRSHSYIIFQRKKA